MHKNTPKMTALFLMQPTEDYADDLLKLCVWVLTHSLIEGIHTYVMNIHTEMASGQTVLNVLFKTVMYIQCQPFQWCLNKM